MASSLKLLLLEDSAADAKLIQHELRQAGFSPEMHRVDNEADFKAALDPSLDVILADYGLPGWRGSEALAVVQRSGFDIPLILVSGTIPDEGAVEIIKQGAADYLLKDRLARLGIAVGRALDERRLRRERRAGEEALRRAEANYRGIFENAHEGIVQTANDGTILTANPALARIFGYDSPVQFQREVVRMARCYAEPADRAALMRQLRDSGRILNHEIRFRRRDGRLIWASVSIQVVKEESGAEHFEGTVQEITERKQAEQALRESEQRFVRQRNTIINLTGADNGRRGDLPARFQRITEGSARALDVSRVSLWLFNPARTAIRCVDLYETAGDRHSAGMELSAADFPAYFRALDQMDVIAVEDPRRDPRTSEFSGSYLDPLGITSMLDAGIRVHGPVEGVLCHEQTGEARVWKSDEHTFAAALANLASLALMEAHRQAAEEALRESERFNRATLDALGAHVAVLNAAGVILATNRAWREFADANATGWQSVSEGVNYLDVCDRAAAGCREAAETATAIRAVAGGGQPDWHFEYPCHSSTEERWFYCRITRFPGNGPVRVVVTHENISAVKQAQIALVQSEERYRQVFDGSPLPMWVCDAGTARFLTVNDAAIRHYGYSAGEFRDMTASQLQAPEPPPVTAELPDPAGPADPGMREFRHRKKDGTIIHVEVYTRPLAYAGRPARLTVATDITEKKLLEEKFLHAQRLESLGMLASGIAHDLNNMLAPISFAVPMLRDRLSDPRGLRILDTVARSAERGAALVRQILGFAHSTTGEPRLIQVKHLLRDIISMVEETFPKSIELEHKVPSDLWPVTGDPTQIHQVLLNLCVNARDAMPQGGTLRIIAANHRIEPGTPGTDPDRRPGRWLMMEVTDTGTGMTPAVVARIWEPFFTTKGAERGTGLGLSTVRGLVATHRGFVELHTAAGQGSTFRVFLPAAEQTDALADNTPPIPAPRGRGELILVVDDDAPIRDIVTAILDHQGYRILSCCDGLEAIALFESHPGEIPLVITDVDMPRLGGVALARELLQLKPDLRIIAMSGLSRNLTTSPDLPVAHPLVHAFLLKPFEADHLLATVGKLLRPAGKADPA